MTRDSVAAGDDIDAPHAVVLTVADGWSVEALLDHAIASAALPGISGGRATWCVSSRLPLQVLAQEWSSSRRVNFLTPPLSELDATASEVRFHFTYFAQLDPELVFEVLWRLRLYAE